MFPAKQKRRVCRLIVNPIDSVWFGELHFEEWIVSRLAQLQHMLAAEPDDLFLNYALGMEYQKTGDSNAALAQFAAMNHRFPDHVAAWHQRGRLLVDLGDHPAACEILKHGVSVAGRVGDSHAAGEMQGLLDVIAAE